MQRIYKFQVIATVRLSGTDFDFERRYFNVDILPGGDDEYNKRKARDILQSEGLDVQDIEGVTVIAAVQS